MSHKNSNNRLTLALTSLLFLSLLIRPLITFAHGGGVLEQAQQRAIDVGAYDFVAEAEQTLIPRPLPSMIGRTDEQVDMYISGQVTLPDQASLQLRLEGGGLDDTPVALVQEGSETYLLKDGEKTPVQNPAGLIAPAGDYLSYLAAAENVQPCPSSPPELGGTEGGLASPPELGGTAEVLAKGGLACYAYDVNGYRFAEHVRQHTQAELERAELPPPPGVEVQPSPLLQRASGQGKVWLDANGLPVRQELDLEIPKVSEYYDAQVHIVVDFRFDERAVQQVAARLDGRRIASSIKDGITDGIADSVAPTDIFFLLLSFLMASLLIAYRRRWVYGLMAVSVCVIIVVMPVLQTVNIVRFQEHIAQAANAVQTLAEALTSSRSQSSVASSQPTAVQSASSSSSSSAPSPDVYCGSGDPNRDSDNDGLNDAAEYCLGTNPYNADSDYDGLDDSLEADGFTISGHRWPGDPLNPDANGDGLTDGDEWVESYIDEQTYINVGGNAESWDPDGDGVPNPWDDDNDGDGVPDNLDLTPFSYVTNTATFTLTLTGGFNGHVYLDLQVQPVITDHLRYNSATLDWPYDNKGQMQDLDSSTEDLRLAPYLEVFTNQPPGEDLREDYGPVSVYDNQGDEDYPYRMLLNLSPVGDDSRPMAFQARLAYGPDAMAHADVRWRNARILWVVTAEVDKENDSGDITTKKTPLQTYVEPSLRVTGFKVAKSRNYASAILGIPSDGSDRQLFNLLFGLSSTWLTHEQPDMPEIQARFGDDGRPVEQKWGVTADVEMDIPADPSDHHDAGIADFYARSKTFLSDNYGSRDYATLIIATEEEIGSDNLGDAGPSADLKVNLAQVSLTTQRTLQIQMYKYEDSDWTPVVGRDLTQAVAKHQADNLNTALDDMSGTYPDLTGKDLFALTEALYLTWQGGRARTIYIGGQPVVPEMRSDQEVYDQLNYQSASLKSGMRLAQAHVPLPTYIVEAGNLAQEGGGLIIGGVNQGWQYAEAYGQQAYDLGIEAATTAIDSLKDAYDSAEKEIVAAGKAIYDVIPTGEEFYQGLKSGMTHDAFSRAKTGVVATMTAVDVFQGCRAAVKAGKVASKGSKGFKALLAGSKGVGKISKLGAATLALDLGLTWAQFAIAGDYSEAAIAMAVAQTIVSVVLFVICLIPVVGQVIAIFVAIFGVVDFILGLCCGISMSGEAAKAIAAMIYDVNVLSKMGDYDFVKPDNSLVYPDYGFIEGNRFEIAAQFEGDIVKGEPQGWVAKVVNFFTGSFLDKLKGSYVYGLYDGSASDDVSGVTAVEKNEYLTCQVQGEKNECTNRVAVEFQLSSSGRNQELRYKRLIRARTYQMKLRAWAFLWGGEMVEFEAQNPKYPEDLPDKDQWDYDTFYLDVLPTTLDELWSWNEITNNDPDADGLSNSKESKLGSDPNKWDSDGDGLSDKFEFDQNLTLGTDLNKYDTDGDGLSDGFEHRLGTRIDKKDSDQDGLNDDQEVYHQNQDGTWSGGWWISLPEESGVHILSDPLSADKDGDGLKDFGEKEAKISPHAYHGAPRLTLEMQPLNTSPSGQTAAYVKPGDTIAMTTTLLSTPPYGVDDDLSICLPSFMTNINSSEINGDRTPTRGWSSCGGPKWSFAAEDDRLRYFETVSAAITADIQLGLSQSQNGTVEARLPYGADKPYEEVQTASWPVVVDVDNPQVTIVDPIEGDLIGGGVEHYVIGGSSSDVTTWVEQIEIDLPVAATETLTRSQSLSPWAYTWELPVDGIHGLAARSYDFVEHVSLDDTVEVMVDNTPATVTTTLTEGAVYGPPQSSSVITVTLEGTASDNYSGLTRVQISTDDGPWRTVWSLVSATEENTTYTDFSANFQDHATGATWDAVWTLPNIESVQGYHSLRVRAYDAAGNKPQILERTIIVDVIPPTSELTNRSYRDLWPHTKAGEAHTFEGVANDAGNVPAPSRPAELSGELDVFDDATIWLGLSTIEDNDAGVSVAWLGDVNNDRRADLAVGLPAAEDGAGRVTIVYGRAGDWPTPTDLEMLGESASRGDVSSFVGEAGAGIGSSLAAAGDVNGDGYDDLLIGDGANDRVFLIFGCSLPLGRDVLLDGPLSAKWSVLTAPADEGIGQWMAAAGDVNGDNFDDMLIGTTGGYGNTYLLLGDIGPWHEIVELDVDAAATIDTGANGARLSSAGDMDGDLDDEFAVADGTTVYLFEGKSSFSKGGLATLSLGDAVDSFASSDTRPPMAALGDVNGDGYDDFIYADNDGGTARVVFGDDTLNDTWTTHDTGYDAASLAAPGNVDDPDTDDYNDVLIGDGSNAYLIKGNSGDDLGAVDATVTGAYTAATSLYAAGADLNSDGSSDLLLVASDSAADGEGFASLPGSAAHINPAWLPHAPNPSSTRNAESLRVMALAAETYYVNDDKNDGGDCDGQTPCYGSIQAAVDVASGGDGDTIMVQPGVYAPFTVSSSAKNNLTIQGTDPDAVFVDAGGSGFATHITNADGVRLEQMTLRNASSGVQLTDAGVGGHETMDKRTILDHLLIYDVSSHDVDMSRTSTVSITHSTLVRGSNHIGTFGAEDTNIDVGWDVMANSPTAFHDGGGMVAIGGSIYALNGGGDNAFDKYDSATNIWSNIADPDSKYEPNSVMAAGRAGESPFDDQVYLIGAPTWRTLGDYDGFVVQDIAVEDDGDAVYAAGNSTAYMEVYTGTWSHLGDALPNIAYAVAAGAWDLYVGGYGFLQQWELWGGVPDPSDSWTDVEPRVSGTVYDLAFNAGGWLYVAGDFTVDTVTGECHDLALCNGTDQCHCVSSDLGSSDVVYAVTVNPDGCVYYGGSFSGPGDNLASDIGTSDHYCNIGGVAGGEVKTIAVGPDDHTVYVGGTFTETIRYGGHEPAPAGMAAWDEWYYLWTSFPEVVSDLTHWQNQYNPVRHSGPHDFVVTDAGELYAVGDWHNDSGDEETFIRWNGTGWDSLADDLAGDDYLAAVAASNYGMLIGGNFDGVGPGPDGNPIAAEYIARLQSPHEVYDPAADSWSDLPSPPVMIGNGASYARDGGGTLFLIPGGGRDQAYRYVPHWQDWYECSDGLPEVTASAMAHDSDCDVYALINGGGFYSFDGSQWTAESSLSVGDDIEDGVSLAYDPKGALYAFAGGDSQDMFRYDTDTKTWTLLDGDRLPPSTIKQGASLVFVPGEEGEEDALYAAPGNYGGSSKDFWRYSLPEPNKVGFEYSAIVAPADSEADWLDRNDPLPEDFNFRVGPGNMWFNSSGEPNNNGSSLPTTTDDPFLDSDHDVYRLQSGQDYGYHTYRDTAYADAGGGKEFSTIQAAIDSRANRVIVEPGVYDPFHLVTGVEVIGANGADWTVIESDGSTDPLVRAEGPVGASLSRFTLDGVNKNVNGLEVDDDAKHLTFSRSLVYDTDTAILIDGSESDLEVVNNTVAHNTNGLQATNCAPVDIRNTIFAHNTEAGLSYQSQSCTPTPSTLHTYNLFWDNGDDFGDEANAGALELFLDPLFVDAADHDYHTLDWSPVIDAGDPGDDDDAPPGEGNRVDIGYAEQGRANYYVDDDYCETCDNDGLTWQTDAFDSIQDALDQAAEALMLLSVSAEEAPQLVVGVGAGVYNETVTVPSHVHLMGNSAEDTTINGGSGGAVVTFDGATDAQVSDLTITGAGSPAVAVIGASNTISITRNIIRSNPTGVAFSERASGQVTFNTIVDNTGAGVSCSDAGSWANVNSNILSGNGIGLSASSDGQIFGDYNLLNNTTDYSGVTQGDYDIVGQNPEFQGGPGPYRITADSPALDAASTLAEVPDGGGERADMGYRELLAAPIPIFLGQQDLSTAMGNSGVGQVEYGVVSITDTARPVTDTLPTIWETATISPGMQGETVVYWETVYTPTVESVHRFYSRATDEVDNQETDEEAWYDGSFVADSTLPIVDWLSPPSGNVDRPLELRAKVADYAAGEFSIEEKDVEFEIDGTIYPAQWAAEPWDEENKDARIFRAWISPTLAAHTAYAVAEDKAGNQTMSGSIVFTVTGTTSPADTVSPTLTVVQPLAGGWVTRTVSFAGTVNDGGSGIASVEVSVDGGYLWMPGTVNGTNWSLTWEGPEGQEFVSYPGRVRASDQAGNTTSTERVFSMDEIPPAGLAPVTFSSPEGTHFDIAATLAITWNTPVDGSGVITTLLAVDQVSDTTPSAPVVGTSATEDLDANGAWYVHLGARDAAGNRLTNHYGPWHVGITDAGTDFGDRQQSIIVDGYLDVENGEWRTATEFLDNDERPENNPAFYSPREGQSFYTAWDGGDFYLAWQGAWWDIDGTLWIYLDAGAGGSNQLISSSPDTGLPFDADYAIEITTPITGTLWHYSGGWVTSAQEWEFAQGESGGTEIRLPLFDTTKDINVIAFALDDTGQVYAIFPTVNSLNPAGEASSARMKATVQAAGSAWISYQWDDITVVTDPSAGQPTATSVELTLDSPQSSATPWGPSSTLEYVVKLENLEASAIAGLQVSFVATPTATLVYSEVIGATCIYCADSSPWLFATDLPTGTTRITITNQAAGNLGSYTMVTSVAALEAISTTPGIPYQGSFTHLLDGQPPTVTVISGLFVQHGPHTVVGTADDGDGVGVASVEVRPQDPLPEAWQEANGTLFWTSVVTVPGAAEHGEPWSLDVRAEDEYSQTSPTEIVTFTVDLEAPTLTMSLPPTVTADLPPALGQLFAEITGTVTDSPTGSRAITVAVKANCGATVTPTPTWQSALVYEPDEDGVQDWLWLWSVPQGIEQGHVCTLTVQTADLVGNVSDLPDGPQQVMVDTTTPTITVTQLTLAVDGEITMFSGAASVFTVTVTDEITQGLKFIAHVYSRYGYYTEEVTFTIESDGTGTYVLNAWKGGCGNFKVYIEGKDYAGNSVKEGPFQFYYPCPSVPTSTKSGNVTLIPSAGDISAATGVANPSPGGAPDLDFPHGFFEFTIEHLTPGQTVVVTITLPSDVPTTTEYWKYGPTPSAPSDHWYQVPMGSNDDDNVITITLVDGGLGDNDGLADGVIDDPGGPGQPRQARIVGGIIVPVNKLGLLAPWLGLAALVVLAALAVALARKRKT